jgi:predicted kinase
MTQGTLVVINGLSGTGKSGMAKRLAADLKRPLISNDTLKEVLFDTLGWDDLEWSERLTPVASALIWSVARSVLEAGQSLVVEGAFKVDIDGPALTSLRDDLSPLIAEIHVQGDRHVLAERVKERAEKGDRHPGHGDQDPETLHKEVIPDLLTEPDHLLEAPDIYLLVDTEQMSDEVYEELLRKVSRILGAGE